MLKKLFVGTIGHGTAENEPLEFNADFKTEILPNVSTYLEES